jgi:hypothetical protein
LCGGHTSKIPTLLMDVWISVHEEFLIHREEIVCSVHSAQHSEGVVHLGLQRVVLGLRVVVSLSVVVQVRIQSLRGVGGLISAVNWRVLSDTENSVHVLFRDFIVWEFEAKFVVAE